MSEAEVVEIIEGGSPTAGVDEDEEVEVEVGVPLAGLPFPFPFGKCLAIFAEDPSLPQGPNMPI